MYNCTTSLPSKSPIFSNSNETKRVSSTEIDVFSMEKFEGSKFV